MIIKAMQQTIIIVDNDFLCIFQDCPDGGGDVIRIPTWAFGAFAKECKRQISCQELLDMEERDE